MAETFIVQNYIDNGQLTGPGTGKPNWIRTATNTDGSAINVREVPDSEITAIVDKSGLTDNAIDPLQCSQCDPVIRILSGRLDTNPGWSDHEFKNKNNHSLVVRIDFDRASFLFTGDMEEQAIETLIDWYSGTDMLDVDVYQVGHHGSYNGTNGSLLNAMSPDMAVISCGQWDFGLNSNSLFTTHRFGHPRRVILDLLGDHIRKRRSSPVNIRAAESSRVFDWYSVRRKIYATPWDGTVKVRAPESAVYRVTRNN